MRSFAICTFYQYCYGDHVKVGHVAPMVVKIWWGILKIKDCLEVVGAGGRIILKRILRKWDEGTWTEFVWLRQGQVESRCERGNEHSGFKKFEEFLHWLRNC